MEILNLVQGSPEWHAHRASHRNASDALAAQGESDYTTRNDLLKQTATGIFPEIGPETQKRFDNGHEYEAQARPWASEIIGEELYPAVATLDVDGIPLSASFDGVTMDESIIFEHKTLNRNLTSSLSAGVIPDQYKPQMEQQLLISGATKCLFMASNGNRDTMQYAWYESDPIVRANLLASWRQFQIDLEHYQHVETVAAPVAAPIEALPALIVQLEGKVVSSNLTAFKDAALTFIKGINTDLQTDQHFADADQMVKFCKDGEDRLEIVKSQALAQTASIDELFRTIDTISAELRTKRLELDRLVKARKETIRGDIVQDGRIALAEHISALNARLGKPYMPTIAADFAGAVKSKRTIDSLRGAVADELARAKIEASAIADKIDINLKHLREHAADYATLFYDAAQIVLKPADDFALLVKSRIDEHKAEVERKEKAAEATKQVIATAQAAPAQAAPAVQAAPIQSVPSTPAQNTPPTLKLGQIADRLGFALPAEFLKKLGFEGTKERGATLFHESDYQRICSALVQHINNTAIQHKEAA